MRSGIEKKFISWVRPGVLEALASPFLPVSALIRLDFPTLERPEKQTSILSGVGNPCISTTPLIKFASLENNLRPSSLLLSSSSS